MAETKTLKKLAASSRITKHVNLDESEFTEHDPFEFLLNRDNIIKAIKECVKENDLDGVMEMVRIYRQAVRCSKIVNQAEDSPTMPSRRKSDADSSARSIHAHSQAHGPKKIV